MTNEIWMFMVVFEWVVMLIDRMRTENTTMMKSAANAGTEVHVCGMSEHESNLCEEFRSFMRF